MQINVSNLDTYEIAVGLLVAELQCRGLIWDDYAVPGGTSRENLYEIPRQTYLPGHDSGSKIKWNSPAFVINRGGREGEQT
jgi:hypothetical protein